MEGLGLLPGQTPNGYLGTGVSGDGSRVVGWGTTNRGFSAEAFLWEGGAMVGLGSLAPAGNSTAWGISADGMTIVGESASLSGDQAYRWHNGAMQGLGFIGAFGIDEDVSSIAQGVSDDGEVVVGSSTSADAFREAFRWQDGAMSGLGDLPGGDDSSWAFGASADGSIIVGWGTTDAGQEAFVWDASHGMRNLRSVLVDAGLDLSGWTLFEASDVSDDGTVIVGDGYQPGRQLRSIPRGYSGAGVADVPHDHRACLFRPAHTASPHGRRKKARLRASSTRSTPRSMKPNMPMSVGTLSCSAK